MAFSLWSWACLQLNPTTVSRITLKNTSRQWVVHLRPRYSQVTLIITQMSIRMSNIKLNTDCICLGHLQSWTKWNGTANSHPPQIKDEAARRAKTRHFPIFDLGGEGGGGLGFPFILSKIPASYARSLQQNSQSERAYYCSHMTMNVHDFG